MEPFKLEKDWNGYVVHPFRGARSIRINRLDCCGLSEIAGLDNKRYGEERKLLHDILYALQTEFPWHYGVSREEYHLHATAMKENGNANGPLGVTSPFAGMFVMTSSSEEQDGEEQEHADAFCKLIAELKLGQTMLGPEFINPNTDNTIAPLFWAPDWDAVQDYYKTIMKPMEKAYDEAHKLDCEHQAQRAKELEAQREKARKERAARQRTAGVQRTGDVPEVVGKPFQ